MEDLSYLRTEYARNKDIECYDIEAREKQTDCRNLLGEKHKGMKVSAPGLLGRIRDGWKVDQGQRYVVGVMLDHLKEISNRFYAGDIKAVDEFFQLYCLDDNRPK